ncbi:hypothetical protein LIER_01606 [Lithospermum erythrorhizon]|uniref:Uncharacterized protein n=1 Tax=Lithospermum erythrorhizon TaxID=34254 RepID=A0AAV3NMQ3_LITER
MQKISGIKTNNFVKQTIHLFKLIARYNRRKGNREKELTEDDVGATMKLRRQRQVISTSAGEEQLSIHAATNGRKQLAEEKYMVKIRPLPDRDLKTGELA